MASDDLLTERLLRVIDEGRRTATYKLALLLALIDSAAARPDDDDELPTRLLAESVVDIYFPQARVFVTANGVERTLRQISNKQSAVLSAVSGLRVVAERRACRTIAEVRRVVPDSYEECVAKVEETFVRYPIPLLQVVGDRALPFLYDVDWREGTAVASLRRARKDRIRFLPGVRDRLVVLGPLLRPLIELHWVRDVARWTGVATDEDQLRVHLFGTDRLAFPKSLRDGLADLQGGRCFYCGRPLERGAQVDHFLAWSRWPNDAIENLVLADACNGAKSDHLAAPDHLVRWTERGRRHAADLQAIAHGARWLADDRRSSALVRSTYTHVVPGTPLWVAGREFVEADFDLLRTLVALVE